MATIDDIFNAKQIPTMGGKTIAQQSREIISQKPEQSAGATTEPVTTPVQAQQEMLYPTNTAELYQALNPQPDEEQLKRKEKQLRRDKLFAALGNGISALSNLFFTTQYAPNMYTPNNLSEKAQARYDTMMSDFRKQQQTYNEGLAKAQQADAEARVKNAQWQHKLGIEAKEQERLDKKEAREQAAAERDAAMDALKEQLLGHQITKAEYDAQTAEIEAQYAELLNKARVDQINASTAKTQRDINPYELTVGGKTYRYRNQANYEAAVRDYANQYGIDLEKESTSTTSGSGYGMTGNASGSRTTTKKIRKTTAELVAEIQEKARQGKSGGSADKGKGLAYK